MSRQATRSGETSGDVGRVKGGKPWAWRAVSQCGLCSPLTQDASNSRHVLERCSYKVQRTPCPTSPRSAVQRTGLLSVPRMATRCGVISTTCSSGTSPPADWHSPQKNDTRKCAQQAPQVKQGLLSDMIEGLRNRQGTALGGYSMPRHALVKRPLCALYSSTSARRMTPLCL